MHAPTEQLAALSYQLILFAVQSGETPQAPQERADRSRENVVRRRHGNEKGTARDQDPADGANRGKPATGATHCGPRKDHEEPTDLANRRL